MKFSKEIKVGLLAVVAIVMLYFGYTFLRGTDFFSSNTTYYVEYDTVDGLNISAPIVLNGVKIGTVKDMYILKDKNNKIRVTLAVDDDITVGDSTIASLSNSDLLGGKAITFFLRPNTKKFTGGETLTPFVEKSITDMLTAKAMPVLGTIDSTLLKLNAFFGEDAKRSIQATILNTQATTEAVKNLMVANQRNINRITSNVADLTSSLKTTEQKFSQLATNLSQITDTLKRAPINTTVRQLNATVAEAQSMIKKFNQDSGTLGKIMNDDSLYRNMNASTESLNALLQDLKANPKRYVHFSLIGGGTKVKQADNVKSADKVRNATTVENTGVVGEVNKK
ncbi:MCE family protein [Adhaeribacter arboris]|uniref:MCE family protein n=1 Tax=Adhaeribacter arboris TaxID=2072846 RepID=A0A2T2YFM6_9BACT|nr:MlaD family protein [Adhaeribacter arboris]PSR54293.1 MCE family protein [Adhaeribacter arboris]